jgi:thymidylate synthase ThyX
MATENQNPYVLKTEDGLVVTPQGAELLQRIVTDAKGPVYAFTGEASPLMAAAAMARLSRSADDLRTTYLNEFAFIGPEGAEKLIDRVVTQYGDDSVQQLTTVLAVIEGASNLLTKKIEWSRLANYLEQSTRYIFFDKKDASGRYKYFTPRNISPEVAAAYNTAMDHIFDLYSEIVRGVTEYVRTKNPEPADKAKRTAWIGATRAQACDAARLVLPVATKSTVGIVCSAQAMEGMIRRLFTESLEEANDTGRMLLKESRKVIGAFLKRADLPDRGLAWVMYQKETRWGIKDFIKRHPSLSAESEDFSKEVELLWSYPSDEMELLPDMLFGGELSHAERKKAVEQLSPAEKEEGFWSYIGDRLNRRHKPGRALENAHYKFEVVADYGTFRDLQRHRLVDDLDWQDLTVKYGYDVPPLIIDAGFEDQFHQCFNLSKVLWQLMMDAGFSEEAQYATLLGHKLRYKLTFNAREAFHLLELRTSPQGHPGYRKICLEMHRLLSEVHPRLGAAMKFVNKSGDPELTRLDAELVTQLKLKLLDEGAK